MKKKTKSELLLEYKADEILHLLHYHFSAMKRDDKRDDRMREEIIKIILKEKLEEFT